MMGRLEPQVLLVYKVAQGQQVQQELMVLLAQRVLLEPMARLELQASKAMLVLLARLVMLAQLEKVLRARLDW
jgi:hypothetical protein